MTGWKANGDILTIIGLSIVGAYILFFFLSIASIVFDQGAYVSNFYMCLKEEPPKYKKGLSLTSSLVLGSLLLMVLLSVTLDLISLWKLRKLEENHNVTQPNQPSIQMNQIQPSNENLVPEFSQQNNETRKIIDEIKHEAPNADVSENAEETSAPECSKSPKSPIVKTILVKSLDCNYEEACSLDH